MKTYTTTIEKPRLEIRYDEMPDKPSEAYDQVSIIINRFDHVRNSAAQKLFRIMDAEGLNNVRMAECVKGDVEFHEDTEVVKMFNLYKYEHSAVKYYIGAPNTCSWDTSFAGFVVVTQEGLDNSGVKLEDIEKVVNEELNEYNCWANGDVLEYVLRDERGEVIDSNSGIYATEGYDTIKHFLDAEWEDENLEDYVIYD